MIYGALEAGGTKMVLSIGNEDHELLERVSIPTENPDIVIPQMTEWFASRKIASLGIGTFGPVDLNPASETYGWITSTPKLAWQNCALMPLMRDKLGVPVSIDTDVNAAALAEYRLGAAKGLHSCLYVTVGTGIGGGLIVEDRLVHGMMHPEIGHILLRSSADDPSPAGFCPYHKGCAEGLASGPAIEKRWGMKANELPEDHIAWDIEADYLAQVCMNAVCAFSPEIIILGGGVMHRKHLFLLIRSRVKELLNNYIRVPQIMEKIDEYIVSPGLGDNSGALGALLLAIDAAQN
ncbi:MAG: ROK family protein [Clostridia bacterium]|nr:ROK family protein [Clostridia bacterium]